MRECGTPNVPSFSALRKMQTRLASTVNLKPELHTSALGNKFFMNHPARLFAMDWANPLVRPFICIYPELTDSISEFWQARKWLQEVQDNDLTPMWADWKNSGHRHYYVNELAQLRNGEFVMPIRWLTFKGEVHAQSYDVDYDLTVSSCILIHKLLFNVVFGPSRLMPSSELRYNFLDLQAQDQVHFTNSSASWATKMPHPHREIAKGRAMFTIRVVPWGDDVSGNVSKQYNAHTNVYVANASLPHRKCSQEYFIRFSSTSPHASTSELFAAHFQDLKSDRWHEAYDCELEQEILFRILAHVLPTDNPQQAESASTVGSKGKFNCRYDKMGGSEEDRETDEGYHAHFPGIPRTPEKTWHIIQQQFRTACLGVQDAVDAIQTSTGVKDKIATYWIEQLIGKARELQHTRISNKATHDERLNARISKHARAQLKLDLKREIQDELMNWVISQPTESYANLSPDHPGRMNLRPGDHFNPLLRADSINPHMDNTLEILHTYLLGNDKYVWHDTNKVWDKKKEEEFAIRLQSSSIDGLTLPPVRAHYIVQYKNSLIGKHFKALQQLAVFHLQDGLRSDLLFEVWKATGELGALIWYPEISDMEGYLADLEVLVGNLLDIWALIDPRCIMVKMKLHILAHIKEDVRRHGPAVLFSTEIFECWNAVFRMCSVLSNHLAPSHNIASSLGDIEQFKHQVSGGWWKDSNGQYMQAGARIRTFLQHNIELQRRLGWVDVTKITAGTVKLAPQKKRMCRPGRTVLAALWPQIELQGFEPDREWVHAKHVISRSYDVCRAGSWVFFRDSEGSAKSGRIFKILAPLRTPSVDESTVVVIEMFSIADVKDTHFNMPILLRTEQIRIVNPKNILFIFNAQHDCGRGKCAIVESSEPVLQERQKTNKKQKHVKHTSDDRFLLNMHALHNASLIRQSLPRHLTAPVPYLRDRRAKHDELAASLRITGPAKRAETMAKTQATKEKNKQAKQSTAGVSPSTSSTLPMATVNESHMPESSLGSNGYEAQANEESVAKESPVEHGLR
ncbi:hypothetical protein BKA93DRAFT_742110 [Sparassis latifolia]